MKTFKIPVSWEVYGTVEIEANSVEEALQIAIDTQDDLPLPTDGDYIDGSFKIDSEIELITVMNS